MSWVTMSIIAMLSGSAYLLLARYLVKEGMPVTVYCFWIVAFLTPMYGIFANKEVYKLTNKEFGLLIVSSLFAFALNYFDNTAAKMAPNPAYPVAIRSFSIIIVCIASKFLLDAELTARGLVGIALSLLGVTILVGGGK